MLYVTSEVGEAFTASHRVIVMNKGRIVARVRPPHLPPAKKSWRPPARTTSPRRPQRRPVSNTVADDDSRRTGQRDQPKPGKINWNAVFVEGRALIALALIIVIFSVDLVDKFLPARAT